MENLISIVIGAFAGCIVFKVRKLLRERKNTSKMLKKNTGERREDVKDVEKKQ